MCALLLLDRHVGFFPDPDAVLQIIRRHASSKHIISQPAQKAINASSDRHLKCNMQATTSEETAWGLSVVEV